MIIGCMQTLRNANILARLVLVWFALFIGVSIASPIVKPSTLGMVCVGSGGIKLVDAGEEGSTVKVSGNMDCPLCVPVMLVPRADDLSATPPDGLSHAMQPIHAAHIAWLTGSPLPPRGPPNLT